MMIMMTMIIGYGYYDGNEGVDLIDFCFLCVPIRSLQTTPHAISSIVHIAHEYDDDDEPWPIEIDDHDGVLRAVDLKEGQVDAYIIVQYACNQVSTSCRILYLSVLLSFH
jgi:hypothetical protein